MDETGFIEYSSTAFFPQFSYSVKCPFRRKFCGRVCTRQGFMTRLHVLPIFPDSPNAEHRAYSEVHVSRVS